MSFDQYSETPASNYISGYFLVGMAPSSVKVAGSDIMADLASRFAALHTTGGTANAQTLTQTRQFGALVAGLEVVVIFGATNTGAMTFAPDGLAAKNVFANGAAALAGQAAQNAIGILKYDGTQWNLLNPSRVTGSFTLTLATGWATTPTGTVNYYIEPDGKTVYCKIPSAITATSNAGTYSCTGWPAIIQPTTTTTFVVAVEDNGTTFILPHHMVITAASGTVTVGANAAGTAGFTTTGVKGWLAGTEFSYSLD